MSFWSTRLYTSKEKSMAHIQAGAKKVVTLLPQATTWKTIVHFRQREDPDR